MRHQLAQLVIGSECALATGTGSDSDLDASLSTVNRSTATGSKFTVPEHASVVLLPLVRLVHALANSTATEGTDLPVIAVNSDNSPVQLCSATPAARGVEV
jgi:hypothetical protein